MTLIPSTWNIVGLDSNVPAFGPNLFPVGATVTGGPPFGTALATFTWDPGGSDNGTYINLRTGGASQTISITYDASGTAEAFFEVEIAKNPAAFDQTRRYHISVGTDSTPTPREIYVEHLVSQGRNGITNMEFGDSLATLASVANGGSMNLYLDKTYFIRMTGFTATQGYEQLESFVSFPNTIFQILSVSTTYDADTTTHVSSPNPMLYGDGCAWDPDPNSPNYLACNDAGKIGGNIQITYQVKILSVGTGRESLSSLIHDFSGSSFHYNADYSTTARFANLIDPATATIGKSFSPATIASNGVSALTITLTNPNYGPVSNVSFSDIFPTTPAAMTLADATSSNSCGGSLTDSSSSSLSIGDTGIELTGGSIPASGSCVIKVNVTAPTQGTYTNTATNFKVESKDAAVTTASASLLIDDSFFPPPRPPSSCPGSEVTLATWSMNNTTTAPPVNSYINSPDVATATATYTGTGTQAIDTADPGTGDYSWKVTNGWPTATTAYAGSPDFLFVVDTSKFGGAQMKFDYRMSATSDWGGNNYLYYDTSVDGATYTATTTITATKGAWQRNIVIPATTAPDGTSYFRLMAGGAASNKTPVLGLDNVTFTGCAAVTINKPTITKAFATSPIAKGDTVNLTFTLTNPNAAYALSEVTFTDNLPPGLTFTSLTSNTCGGSITDSGGTGFGSGDTGIKLNNGALAKPTAPATSTTCQIVAVVNGATAGSFDNASEPVSARESGANTTAAGIAKASLTVIAPPTVSKGFFPDPILQSGVSRLIFSLVNPNPYYAMSGVTLSDTLPSIAGPSQMVVAATSPDSATVAVTNGSPAVTGTRTLFVSQFQTGDRILLVNTYYTIASITDNTHLNLTANYAGATNAALSIIASTSGCGTPANVPAGAAISYTGMTIAAGGTCQVRVNVTAPGAGTYTNSTYSVSHTLNGVKAGPAPPSASLTVTAVHPSISLRKEIGPTAAGPWAGFLPVATGGTVYYRFTVENTGDVPLSTVGVSDPTLNAKIAACTWTNPLNPLPVAVGSNNNHISTCVTSAVTVTNTPGPTTTPPVAPYRNTATASGTYASTVYTDVDTADYATTGLSIDKNATTSHFGAAGTTLSYTYVVANTGYATLAGPATVADDKATATCPSLTTAVLSSDHTTAGDLDNFLDPGEEIICTANHTVTAAEVAAKSITNIASATLDGVSSGTDTVTVPLAPELTAVKTNSAGGALYIGGSFDWTLTVSNEVAAGNGQITAPQVILVDDLPASGATYVVGAVKKAGVTGPINCAIASNTLTCSAGGVVAIPATVPAVTVAVTNDSAAVIGTGTAFSSQYQAGSTLLLAGVPYTVLSITDDTHLTLTTKYQGATAAGLLIPASFTVPVTVTPTTWGSLVNPKSGGTCKVDPGMVIMEIEEANNGCADTVTVKGYPSLVVVKSVQTIWDPVNAGTSPQPIPGALADYTIVVTNTGPGTVDDNTTVLTDPIPANTELFVGDIDGVGPSVGPILFTDGAVASGLSYTFDTLASTTDNLAFSGNNGADLYLKNNTTPDGNQCDPSVTNIKVPMSGIFNASNGVDHPSFNIRFRVRIK